MPIFNCTDRTDDKGSLTYADILHTATSPAIVHSPHSSAYRKFVRNFAMIAEPLTRLTKKNPKFEWWDEAQEGSESLKRTLVDITN